MKRNVGSMSIGRRGPVSDARVESAVGLGEVGEGYGGVVAVIRR